VRYWRGVGERLEDGWGKIPKGDTVGEILEGGR